MISHNLLTRQEKGSGDALQKHDLEVIAIIRRWREEARLSDSPEYGTGSVFTET